MDPFTIFSSQSCRALVAIAMAPSRVAFPPMNPEAWTKMHPGMPVNSDSCSSRTPLHLRGANGLSKSAASKGKENLHTLLVMVYGFRSSRVLWEPLGSSIFVIRRGKECRAAGSLEGCSDSIRASVDAPIQRSYRISRGERS